MSSKVFKSFIILDNFASVFFPSSSRSPFNLMFSTCSTNYFLKFSINFSSVCTSSGLFCCFYFSFFSFSFLTLSIYSIISPKSKFSKLLFYFFSSYSFSDENHLYASGCMSEKRSNTSRFKAVNAAPNDSITGCIKLVTHPLTTILIVKTIKMSFNFILLIIN